MSALNIYMQGSHSVISYKPSLHKKNIRTIKTQKACVTNKNKRVCLFESNTDLIIVPLSNFLLQRKH